MRSGAAPRALHTAQTVLLRLCCVAALLHKGTACTIGLLILCRQMHMLPAGSWHAVTATTCCFARLLQAADAL
jgi:hypothetical protein